MSQIIGNRVRETSNTIGTGTYNLNGAVLGYQDIDTLAATNDTVFYVAVMGDNWEVGLGTFTSGSPDTLARTTIYASTNAGAAVSWATGTKDIFTTIPARFMEFLNMIEETVASAATCDIGAVNCGKVAISGTTTITSFGSQTHKARFIRFTGALTLTHNATSLILPGGANITTAAGDTAIAFSDGSGNWRVWDYRPADAGALNGQIKFPATQNASANANTLDDYEEGTFTPTITVGGSSTGITYTTQTGTYTKIGNRCLVSIILQLSAKGSFSGGAVAMAGLPFTSSGGAQVAFAGYINVSAALSNIVPTVANGVTTITINYFSGGNVASVDETHITASTVFVLGGQYQTA